MPDTLIMHLGNTIGTQALAFRPERIVQAGTISAEWTAPMLPPISLFAETIIARAWIHRGRRVVGRRIRQQRRKARRAFGVPGGAKTQRRTLARMHGKQAQP